AGAEPVGERGGGVQCDQTNAEEEDASGQNHSPKQGRGWRTGPRWGNYTSPRQDGLSSQYAATIMSPRMTRAESSTPPRAAEVPKPGARTALVLLLGINLFNYVDRTVLASVESLIRGHFGVSPADTGWLATAFLLSYMVFAPLFGWLADRYRRWLLVAV